MKSIQAKPFNLIVLGDPGAGKATQAAYIAKKYKMYDFDMGRELALLRKKNSAVDQAQKRTADKGLLTPTTIVRKILTTKVKTTPSQKGILFDGHPKMIGEAKILKNLLQHHKRSEPLVIYLSIPEREMIKRVLARKGYTKTSLVKRSDDTLVGLKNRARYYREQIRQVTKYFSKHYNYVTISGLGTRTEVRARIQKAIQKHLKANG